ncbi:MAG: tripartite motif-containing protein 71 [Planctomycetota bacterium]|jgi:tripartite motif-containing protein 71
MRGSFEQVFPRPIAPTPRRFRRTQPPLSVTPILHLAGSLMLPYALASLPALVGTAQEVAPPPAVAAIELGGWTATIEGLHSPEAVAIGPRGHIFVAETGAHRVRIFTRSGEPVASFGARGHRPGEFLHPAGIAVHDDGRICVADTGNDRVQLFDAERAYVRTIASRGAGRAELQHPLGLAFDGESLWVADSGNERVQCFSLDGEWRLAIAGGADGALSKPTAVATIGELVFVADSGLHHVSVFDKTGAFQSSFGGWGFFPGLFSNLSGLCPSGDRLYTADGQNHRVQVFSTVGELEHDFGLHAIVPREGEGKLHYPAGIAVARDESFLALAEPADDRVQIFGPKGEPTIQEQLRKNAGQPSPHYGYQFTASRNHMVIVEPETHVLLVYDLQWDLPRLIGRLGGYGEHLGLFRTPRAAVLDGDSLEIWAAEDGGRSIQHLALRIDREGEVRFDYDMPKYIQRIELARFGRELGGIELEWPARADALARDASGYLWAVDVRNERVHVFDDQLAYRFGFGVDAAHGSRLLGATDIALAPNGSRVYVVESNAGRVRVFDAKGATLDSIGDGLLDRPYGIAVAADGSLFVTDAGTHELVRFSPAGEVIARWGGAGLGRREFYKPRGVSFFGQDRVVVMDHGNHRLQWFTLDGEYKGVFGSRLYTRPARLVTEAKDPAQESNQLGESGGVVDDED